jgi:hypothetical protein
MLCLVALVAVLQVEGIRRIHVVKRLILYVQIVRIVHLKMLLIMMLTGGSLFLLSMIVIH